MAGSNLTGVCGVSATLAELPGLTGRAIGPTEWRRMTQERVDEFADVTEDHNYIHVDVERAKDSPFGGTIAHGYLTVSLLAPISQELLQVTDAATSVNYGMDRLRFPAPLPVGAEFRGRGEILEVTEIKGGTQVKVAFAVEVKDAPKPALVAECLFRHYA
jgi:acyl dehydratase